MNRQLTDHNPLRKVAEWLKVPAMGEKLTGRTHSAMVWNNKTYETDKIGNGFMPDYERILAEFRQQAVQVLEIGVFKGGSCTLWSDFFPHPESRITGLDIVLPKDTAPTDPRITLEQCDQNDSARLREIAERSGPFDIIIDDGAHRLKETRNCYQVLFEYLQPGGYYIIEDWGVGYWKDQQQTYGGPNGNTMVTLITSIMQSIPDAPIAGYQIILDTHKSLAFFRKGTPWQA
jgi:demethylmacrocin O-methyltransferase